ncbi:MAG: lipoprotein insertase outer membrane protein LolB [Gammaproteobacteria bacterium]|nr:lipoprotein insertase outer membrane protein LolB [Gammaproteobacteria bacterium]
MRAVLLLILLLSGCSIAPKAPPVEDVDAAWAEHQRRLSVIERWQLEGKLALHSEQQSGSAQLWWRQTKSEFDLRITPPFGVNKVRIRGGEREVVLYPASGHPLRASSAEALLQREVGWLLPLQSLRYWVLGLPAEATEFELNAQGQLQSLFYQGWQVSFVAYQLFETMILPSELVLRYQDLKLRLAIHEWQLNPVEPASSSRLRPPNN